MVVDTVATCAGAQVASFALSLNIKHFKVATCAGARAARIAGLVNADMVATVATCAGAGVARMGARYLYLVKAAQMRRKQETDA